MGDYPGADNVPPLAHDLVVALAYGHSQAYLNSLGREVCRQCMEPFPCDRYRLAVEVLGRRGGPLGHPALTGGEW